MAGTVIADAVQAASTSQLVIKNGVALTPPTIVDVNNVQIGTFCRAWVNFDGTTNTGGFCTVRGSFNVSSVADNGTGTYTVNFTNAMPDTNYATQISSYGGQNVVDAVTTYTTTAVRVLTRNGAGSNTDQAYAFVTVFR